MQKFSKKDFKNTDHDLVDMNIDLDYFSKIK